nr:hypothetical protein [Tanacetum cinerariifolium]
MIGKISFFLGLQISQSLRGIFINQSKYALESLKKYGFESCDPVDTPVVEKSKLDKDKKGKAVDPLHYPRPTEKHLHAVKRIFRYLRGTVNRDLWYSKDSSIALIAFKDADHAGCQDTQRSTSSSLIPNQQFDELPFEEAILTFLRELGHNGEIKMIIDVNINKLHQPWRSFAAVINKCLSGKSTGAEPPKTKASVRKKQSSSDTTMPPPTAKGKRLKTSAKVDKPTKEKQPAKTYKAKGLTMLYKVALTKAKQMKLATKRSLTQTHISHASGLGADEGIGIILGVPDVPTYESDNEEISWKSSEDNDDDEVNMSEHDKDVDDQSDDNYQNDDDDQNDNDDEQTDSDNDSDDFIHPKFSTHYDEDKEEESFDPIVKTPSHDKKLMMKTMMKIVDVSVTTTVKLILLSATTLPPPPTPIIPTLQQSPVPSPANVLRSSLPDPANLSKLKLKKILIEKIKSNKSIYRSDKQKNLYKALVDAYECDKLILDTYRDTITLKKRRDDEDKDEEPFARSYRDTLTPELLASPTYELMKGSCKSLVELEFFFKEVYKATTDQIDWNNPKVMKTKPADYGHIKWIKDLVPCTMWSQVLVIYDKHALWGISHWGHKRQQFYGFAVNRESARDVYSKRRIIAVTELQIVKWHNYKHLDWITVRRDDEKLYKFKEGDFKRLYIQDIDDMLLFLNKYKQNRLIRIDELHKFSDDTLNDVQTALDDRLKGIQMQYLPQTIWRRSDKDRATAMIQAIDKQLKTRRIMQSLEKFVVVPAAEIQLIINLVDIALASGVDIIIEGLDGDDDDDDYDKESIISTNADIFETPPSIVITTSPPILPIEDPKESLIMRNEELNTIPKKELDEFIKSRVKDLIPISSKFEDTSGSESVCILPSCDDIYPIDIPEEKAVTFPNHLFNSNDDFISSDDESLSNEDVSEDNVKIYSNPLFEFDDEYISSDINPLFDEVLEDIECKDSYDHNLDESTFLVTPLSDSNKDEYFTPADNGFTDEPPLEENDVLFDLKSKNDDWKKILYDAQIDDLMSEDKFIDTGIHDQIFSPTYADPHRFADYSNQTRANDKAIFVPRFIANCFNVGYLKMDVKEKVQLLMQGTSLTKLERECKLYDAFDKFTYIKGETLHKYYLRFTQLINVNIYNMRINQFQVNTKFLNSLSPEWSKFVTDVKLVKDLHTTNFDQLHACLEQHKLHANKVRLLRERNQDPLAFVANQQITSSYFNTYQSSYNNPQLQQQFSPSQYGSIHPNQHYSPTYPSPPQSNHSSIPSSYPHQSQMNHQTSSVSQIAYQSPQVTTQLMIESPLIDSCFAVLVFSPGDDPISCLNKAMDFLTSIASSRFPSTNSQLRTSSNPRNQATIQDGRVIVQQLQGRQGQSYSGTGSTVPDGQADLTIIPNNAAFQTEDLDTYDSDCDDISNAQAILISNYGSDDISEELLVYVQDTCPNAIKPSAKKVVVTPKNKVKKVRFVEPLTFSSNIKQVESSTISDSNTPVLSPIGLKCFTSNYRTMPSGNKMNDRILQTPSRNIKNEVEAQPRNVNKKNRVVEPICNVNVNQSQLNTNSKLICATCKKSMFDGVHDICLLDFVKNVNSRVKSAKNHKKQNIWKLTGHVFTEVGFKWKPTGRTFTIVGNSCPLTRITSANVVPPKKTTYHSVESQKLELKVYSRKPKNVKNGSNATDIPSSSSLVMTGFLDCSLESGLQMFETHDREPLSAHELYNGTIFVNQILRAFFENVGISHQTSVARTPQQNDVVERRNWTLVEAARTMTTHRAWYDMLSSFLISQQFSKGAVDPTFFTWQVRNDLLLMTTMFKMSMMGQMSFFLGLQISQSPRGIFLDQSKYAFEIVKKYGMLTTDSINTPLVEKSKLDEDLQGKPVDATLYRVYSDLYRVDGDDFYKNYGLL